MFLRFLILLGLATWLVPVTVPSAAPVPAAPEEVPLRDALAIRSVGRSGRSVLHTDALEARIVAGEWQRPVAGEAVRTPAGGEQTWEAVTAGKEGWLESAAARGGYVYWPVYSSQERVMLLEAAGHNLVYVNGEIRAGDPYAYGYMHLPVLLHAGTNDLLFQCSRGRFRARLATPAQPLLIETDDATLPDLVLGETGPLWGAAVVVNCTTNSLTVSVRAAGGKRSGQAVTVPPLGFRKAPFVFQPPRLREATNCSVTLEAEAQMSREKIVAHASVKLRSRRPDQTYKRTFVSPLDDSVQYYAVNPPPAGSNAAAPALFLSLHGASVEAIGQADAYSPKRWGYLICPTNRRPYGFDWEEWGQLDALEVLDLATARYHPDPARVYLTGHSMGGHGTWQVGAWFPDRFAAIGASAGWISFTSYTETNRPDATNAVQRLLRRSATASDTLLLASNYLNEGVYILHGGADDNVPVTEARHMRQVLSAFHRDYVYYEQPGAGHWWDVSDEPGADCVDWAPLFDFFAHHIIPADDSLRQVQFTTVNPAVSSRCHWVAILAQEHQLEPSSVTVRCDPGKRRLAGTTTNVACLRLELPALTSGAPLSVELDGQKLENIAWPIPSRSGEVPAVCLALADGLWKLAEPPAPSMKNPDRSGPFRHAFRNHMVFVYATQGTPEENAWALAKARYDAEGFYYRGNGSVELMADSDFVKRSAGSKHGARGTHRNVLVYGNADNNSAWPLLLAASPVQVHRGAVRVGGHEWSGNDLACLFLRPRPNDDHALVGVISGSGLPGLRFTERFPYFLSGAGFPDCLVVGSEALTKGPEGVRAAGFFGQDWAVETGEFGWGE